MVADEADRKQKHRVKSARLMSQRNKLASDRVEHLQRHKTMDADETLKNQEIINAAVRQAQAEEQLDPPVRRCADVHAAGCLNRLPLIIISGCGSGRVGVPVLAGARSGR